MKKRGFTLIELLAVIVVLAIIALIATPIVMNIIDGVKLESTKRTVENYLDAIDITVMNAKMAGEDITTCAVNNGNLLCGENDYTIETKGTKINDFEVQVDEFGKVVFVGKIEGMCAIKRQEDTEVKYKKIVENVQDENKEIIEDNCHIMIRELPLIYQEVEYVESTGTEIQYIDTGYVMNAAATFECIVAFLDVGANEFIPFGAIQTISNNYKRAHFGVINNRITIYQSNSNQPNYFGINDKQYHTYKLMPNGVSIDETVWLNSSDILNYPTNTMWLFYRNTDGDYNQTYGKARITSCIISENGQLIHNFVPCYRKSDGEVGMYDVVSKKFYTNQGTGTFQKGPNVSNT